MANHFFQSLGHQSEIKLGHWLTKKGGTGWLFNSTIPSKWLFPCMQSSCKYRFYDQPQVCTPLQSGQNPVYADERIFLYKPITQQVEGNLVVWIMPISIKLLDYLTESALVIEGRIFQWIPISNQSKFLVLAIQRDRKHPIIDSLSNEFIHPNKESHALKEQKISAGNKVAFKKRISNKNTSLGFKINSVAWDFLPLIENVKHIGRGSLQLQSKSYDQSPKSPTAGRTFVKRYSTSQIEEGISKEGTHQKNIPPRRKNWFCTYLFLSKYFIVNNKTAKIW